MSVTTNPGTTRRACEPEGCPVDLAAGSRRCLGPGIMVATREMPRSGFPCVDNAVRRVIAARKRSRCPDPGAPAGTS
jgi:hypothetical protein